MPGKGIRNAVYKRAGGKGQSSRFYNIYGKVVKPTDPTGFKGGQGWTAPKPQIGSMLSLGIMKQNRNAGGNNVCQPGPKNPCVPALTADNIMTVGTTTNGGPVFGYGAPTSTVPAGSLSPTSFAQDPLATVVFIYWIPTSTPGSISQLDIVVDYTAAGLAPTKSSAFQTISFVNCDDQSVRTYSAEGATTFNNSAINAVQWAWDAAPNPFNPQENAFWTNAVGKNIKVIFDSTSKNIIGDYCCNNNDCKCRGPLAQCPCRKGGC